jgi:hypothetical protein
LRFNRESKAAAENKSAIAAVNRCATQKQEQDRVFRKLLGGFCIPERAASI